MRCVVMALGPGRSARARRIRGLPIASSTSGRIVDRGNPVRLPVSTCLKLSGERFGLDARREAGDLEAIAVVVLTPDDPHELRTGLRLLGGHALIIPD